MLVARNRSEAVSGKPKIDMRRLNSRDLGESPGRPMQFDPANDERPALDRFGPLMLKGCRVAIAELGERELALRRIDLLLLLL